ncbi:MAG: DUF721 domain-containing protein [Rikenellaceae bacterium]|jgi:hypothetical protein|nr:DUF721 domain-containing protein [Rikenellaceae bacterium]
MRRTAPVSIGQLLDEFFGSDTHHGRMLAEARAIDLWPTVVGPRAAAVTTRAHVRNGRMTVYLSSSVLRHEIFMQRTSIASRLNNALGQNVITAIIVK